MRWNSLGGVLGALLVAGLVGLAPGTAGAASSHQKPGVPTGLSVIPADTALVVSWSPPADPGSSPVEGYTVIVRQLRHSPTCVMTGPTSCLASGLTNGRPVNIRVRAVNSFGPGPKSGYVAGIPDTTPDCAYVGPYGNLQGCGLRVHQLVR